jgi:hypothetical protein
MSNRTTGSNYQSGFKSCTAVRPELQKTGPFLSTPNSTLPSHVLTKTHCGGYCDSCKASDYVQSIDDFERSCGQSHHCDKSDRPAKEFRYYPASAVDGAVHLVRSPFDNLVARKHYAVQRRRKHGWTEEQLRPYEAKTLPDGTNFTNEQAFNNWCSYADGLFDLTDREPVILGITNTSVWKLFLQLPCRAEWYRYVQW